MEKKYFFKLFDEVCLSILNILNNLGDKLIYKLYLIRLTSKSYSTISRRLKILKEFGLIEQVESTSPAVAFKITEKGKRFVEKLNELFEILEEERDGEEEIIY